MEIQDDITREDIEFCQKCADKDLATAATLEAKAKNCRPGQRGAYRSNAAQKRKSAQMMQDNTDALMRQLERSNPALWRELRGGKS